MAVFDISSKLGNEKPRIKIAEGKEYEVNNGADTFIIIEEKFKKEEGSVKALYEIIETVLGEQALKDIKEMKLTVAELNVVITGILAAISEISYEEMEERLKSIKQ